MIVIEPFDVIGGLLTSSNIPEPDAAAGEVVWAAGTYSLTEPPTRRIMTTTHKLYECVAVSGTTDQPDVGASKAVKTWVEVSATNRYRMFDQVNSSQSTRATPLTVEITAAKGFDSAAIFNSTGVTSVRFQVRSQLGVLVYDRTLEAVDNSMRTDWLKWLFSPMVRRFKFFVNDMPRAANQKLTVTINGTSSVAVGSLVVGKALSLGVACYGSSFKYINGSKVDENDFGDLTITPRRKYKFVDYDVRTDRTKLDFVVNTLSGLVDKPCVWAGTNNPDDPTAVLGYYVGWQQNIDSPIKCTATFQIRELV
jgi:hypothetical protein